MNLTVPLLLFATLTVSACASRTTAPASATSTRARIGVYDSRAVAIAYCNTPLHRAELEPFREAARRARATGSAAEMARAEAGMRAAQDRLHLQGFSTHPVDDILRRIPDEVARIQAEANVSALVSRWDEPALAAYRGAERVDVTLALIEALHPTERQRRYALDIRKQKPIPPEKLAAHDGH